MADFDSVMAQLAYENNIPSTRGGPIEASPWPSNEQINAKRAFDTDPQDVRKANVAAASERKQAAMGKQMDPNPYQTAVGTMTGQGLDSSTGIERDIRTMTPNALRFKYGDKQASDLMFQASNANQEVMLDRAANRSGFKTAWDSAVDIGSGFVMPALDIGAFGLGLASDEAGTAASLGLEKLNNLIRTEGQSNELGQRRKVNEARNALDSRDSELIQKQQLASGTGEVMAGLNRLGRGIANSVSNAADDSAILGSGLASGVGSLLAGGPLAKGAAKAGEVALAGLGRAGVIKSGGAVSSALSTTELASAVRASAFPATIGMMEGASVYQQTVADSYNKLIAQGETHESAVEKATDAGTVAFAITFPAAVGLSKLVQGFETAPFAKTTVKHALAGAVNETLEEGGQSGTGRWAQNVGTKLFVDPKQDLLDQVGEQAGEGGLYGMGTSLAISGPGAALASTGDSAKYLWGKASTAAANPVAKIQAANAAASPLSPANVAAQVAATQAAMPAAAAAVASVINPAPVAPAAPGVAPSPATASPMTPEAQAATQAYADKLMTALDYDDEAKSELAGHPLHRNIQNHTSKADALMELANIVTAVGNIEDPVIFDAAMMVNNYVADLEEAMRDEPDTLSSLPANHPAVKHLNNIKKTIEAVRAQPVVKAALARIAELVEAQNTSAKAAAITSESLATPEGQQAAQTAINAIAVDPSKANQDLVNVVLKHASTGEITLTKKQQKALSLATTLFDMAREDFANRQKLGLLTQDIVSNQIQSAEYLGKGQLSAVQHATAIHDAYKANDMARASALLEEFRKFGESMQNKLKAFNQHLNTGNGDVSKAVPYTTVSQDTRMFKDSAKGVWVKPTNENSVKLMQDVAADAKMLSDTYSHLQKIFPELNGAKLTPVKVDSRMNHPTVGVVKAFRTGVQPTKPIPVKKEKPVTPEATQSELNLTSAVELRSGVITREMLRAEPDTLFVFGDNDKRAGFGGQAKAMRGEPNAVGIRTKAEPSMATNAFWTDATYDQNTTKIDQDFARLENHKGKIVIPANGIGTGLADLSNKAPKTFAYLQGKLSSILPLVPTPEEKAADLVARKEDADKGTTAPKENQKEKTTTNKAEPTEETPTDEGPLPWETDEEYAQRTATAVAVAPAVVAPVVASLTSTDHNTVAEASLLNELAAALGVNPISSVTSIQDIDNIGAIRGGVYFSDVAAVGIDNALVGASRLSVLLHEFGHHVTYDKLATALGLTPVEVHTMTDVELLAAFRKEVPSIAAEYDAWLASRTQTSTDPRGRIRTPLFQSALSKVIYQALVGKQFDVKVSADRISTFHEWMADNIGKSLESTAKTQSITEKFFKSIADAFVKIYEMVTSTKELSQFLPAKSVSQWLNGMLENAPPAVELTGLAGELSNLFSGKSFVNRMTQAFKFPKEVKSRISLLSNPLETITDALKNEKTLGSLIDGDMKVGYTRDTAKAYKVLMEIYGEQLKQELEARLQRYMDKVSKEVKTGVVKSNLERVLDDKFEGFDNGQVFNLLQEKDGKLTYDPRFMEAAVVAAMQWLITSDQATAPLTKSSLASSLGVMEGLISDGLVDALSYGQYELDATTSLTRKINEYWGLDANKDAPSNIVHGISGSMAAEILVSFEAMKLTTYHVNWFTKDMEPLAPHGTKPRSRPSELATKMHHRIQLTLPEAEFAGVDNFMDALHAYPDAIEQAVMVKPETVVYLEDERPDVARTQLRNPQAKNSKSALVTIEANQNQPYNFNNQYDLYKALGVSGMLELFGFGDLTDEQLATEFNVNHRSAIEGKNASVAFAFDGIEQLFAQVAARAEALGKTPEEINVHFAMEFSKVQRLQMMGRTTPQGDKSMRAALTPHNGKLDLNKQGSEHHNAFLLAIAQSIGIRIHEVQHKQVFKDVQALLKGELSPVIDMLKEWLPNKEQENSLPEGAVELIKSTFKAAGADLTNLSLQAMTEYAQYQNTKKNSNERKNFVSHLNIEADGMANGPMGAQILHTTGPFTEQQLRMWSKGGYYPGQKDHTSQDNFAIDKVDSYGVVADRAQELIVANKTSMGEAVAPIIDNLLDVMTTLWGGNVTFDGENLKIKRGAAKSPVTVTLYGAGEWGIATKISGALTDALYEKMSEVAALMYKDPTTDVFTSVFGSQENFSWFAQAWQGLTNTYLKLDNDTGQLVVLNAKEGSTELMQSLDHRFAVNFTVEPATMRNLTSNIRTLFVEPMVKATEEKMGRPLMNAMELIQQSTQLQSIFLEDAFKAEVEAALERKKDDPSYIVGDFLSQNELDAITAKLKYMMPAIQTEDQNYNIPGSASAEMGKQKNFGKALNEWYATPATAFGPKNSGVSGIAAMNIGGVDGLMIQYFYNKFKTSGTLPVFDGVNLPLDKHKEYSVYANQAAFDAWMGNQMKAIHKSFEVFMKDTKMDFVEIQESNPTMFAALAKAIYGPKVDMATVDATEMQVAVEDINARLRASAISVEARHIVMKQVGAGIDQMASSGTPYWNPGAVDLSGMTHAQRAEAMNALLPAAYASIKESYTENETTVKPFKGVEGQLAFHTASDLKARLTEMNLPKEQKKMLQELLFSGALKEWVFVSGSPAELQAHATSRGVGAELVANIENGLTLPGHKMVLLANNTSETLIHEMIHAATFATAHAYYAGTLNNADAKAAVERIEGLMNQFVNLADELPALSFETRQQYNHTRSVIESFRGNSDPTAKASALSEFMAYTLSNQALIRLTKNTKANPLFRILKDAITRLKELLFGKRSLYVSYDMFTNVRFNSVVLAKLQPSVLAQLTVPDAALPHSSPASGARLIDIRTNFLNRIGANLRQPTTYNNLGRTAAQMQAVKLSAEAALAMNNHGFQMSPLENSTFTSIVQALATQAKIDPNTMARAQELFNLTTKAMTADMFIEPGHDPHVAQYYANEKYRAVLGDYTQGKDAFGRSTLLPIFLGLAMTNDKFREVLSKINIPKNKLKKGETLDETLENVGNTLIDKLSNRLSGQGKHQPDVQAAIDALTTHLLDQAQDDKSWAEQALSQYGNKVNGVNDWIVEKLGDSADFLTKQATKLRTSNANFAKKTLATLADTTAAIISEKSSDAVAQSVVTMINNINGFRTLREVIADMVGRTESNAELYDQNKLVRSMVSQDRQHYREDLPKELLTHFKEEMSKEQLTAMFHGVAKTDIASLFPVMNFKEVRELFTKPSALSKRINDLESSIQSADPVHWNKVQIKAAQLATYMTTGAYGSNLLRNARAVSHLFGEITAAKRVAPTDAYIKEVDALISLYAVDNLSKENLKILSSLVQDESGGVDFIMSYLIGQQAEELRKIAGSQIAQDNYFKGFIPSDQESGVTLLVAEDSKYADLKIKSFTEVASYSGSSLAFSAPKSYFFAKVAGRAAYNQGAMQNARQTANGIDLATGFTDGMMTAGRITDRQIVDKIVAKMGQERATAEPLLPLYVDGKVFAFERSVDPVQLERLNQNTDITKMIGVWRGRQVEEAKVQIFNEALVDAAKKMYKDDIQLGRKAEYINVFDPKEQKKDPVMADAVKLLNPETRTYLEAVFGKDNFPVRKDMLNDMLGYRGATVGDMWSGNHRWSKQTEEAVRNIAITMFGNKAYEYMTKAESAIQGVVSSAKTLIVMKSVVVPISNIIGNVYQLMSRGVPLMSIGKGMPRKFAEIEAYTKSRKREVAVEAQIRAAVASSDVRTEGKLRVELQSIKDSYERLSIAPLIKAGQFSAISDMGLTKEDVELSQGKLTAYMENLVDKLPESVRTAGRYALITKDTALFQGMQKAVDYGDFIAKAILYDDLTQRKGLTKEAALARIMEEFVNYDRLPGRSRGYLESVGLLWFYNFKLRLVKIALSTIRNNPVHALMVGMAPKPTFFGSIGTPISDNFLTMGVNGELGASVGIGMALNAPTMNPFVAAVY